MTKRVTGENKKDMLNGEKGRKKKMKSKSLK